MKKSILYNKSILKKMKIYSFVKKLRNMKKKKFKIWFFKRKLFFRAVIFLINYHKFISILIIIFIFRIKIVFTIIFKSSCYIYFTPRAKVYFKRLLLHQNIIYSKSQKRAYFMKIKTFFFLVFWLTNLSLYLYIYIKIWLTKLIKKT